MNDLIGFLSIKTSGLSTPFFLPMAKGRKTLKPYEGQLPSGGSVYGSVDDDYAVESQSFLHSEGSDGPGQTNDDHEFARGGLSAAIKRRPALFNGASILFIIGLLFTFGLTANHSGANQVSLMGASLAGNVTLPPVDLNVTEETPIPADGATDATEIAPEGDGDSQKKHDKKKKKKTTTKKKKHDKKEKKSEKKSDDVEPAADDDASADSEEDSSSPSGDASAGDDDASADSEEDSSSPSGDESAGDDDASADSEEDSSSPSGEASAGDDDASADSEEDSSSPPSDASAEDEDEQSADASPSEEPEKSSEKEEDQPEQEQQEEQQQPKKKKEKKPKLEVMSCLEMPSKCQGYLLPAIMDYENRHTMSAIMCLESEGSDTTKSVSCLKHAVKKELKAKKADADATTHVFDIMQCMTCMHCIDKKAVPQEFKSQFDCSNVKPSGNWDGNWQQYAGGSGSSGSSAEFDWKQYIPEGTGDQYDWHQYIPGF